MTTRDRKVFDEQAKQWPGVEVFAKYTWNCVCTDPDCLMNCIQSIGRWFGSQQMCENFFNDIAHCTDDEGVKETMSAFADMDPVFSSNLERAYQAQMEDQTGVSQRFRSDPGTVH